MKLTEKQKNCPYCHGDRDAVLEAWDLRGTFELRVESDGYAEIGLYHSSSDMHEVIANGIFRFCPKCGRPLNEEEE